MVQLWKKGDELVNANVVYAAEDHLSDGLTTNGSSVNKVQFSIVILTF